MVYKKSGNVIIIRLKKGDEIVESLLSLAEEQDIMFAQVTGIGATDCADFGCFNTSEKQYKNIHKDGENFEITSLVGNLSEMDGKKYQHLHINISDGDGRVYGGHLKKAIISVTAEIIVTFTDTKVGRVYDETVGANLLDF